MPESIALADILARPGVRQVLALLNRDGEEARIVGGAVRNALMGIPVSDIDIATTALPDVVLARAKTAGVHAVPTGYEHGTVTLVIEGAPHEVTTLREDIETDGRRAVVRFGRDFARDALRRDFTVNALSVDTSGHIHDYASGLEDIAACRIRFIGDADQRIAEDYLRILRLFRFSAAFGDGTLDADGYAAAIRNRDGLARLSRERIRQETMKLIVARQAIPVMVEMNAAAILGPVLAGGADLARCAAMAVLEQKFGLRPDPVRRLLSLTIDTLADVARLRDALRLTNREVERMEAVVRERDAAPVSNHKVLLYRLGTDLYRDVLLDCAARTGADIAEAYTLPDRWLAPQFLLTGKDLLALGVPKGREIGRLLAEAEATWIAAGMPEGIEEQRSILAAAAELNGERPTP